MSDDLVKRAIDEQYDTHIEVALNPYGAWQAIQALTAERDAEKARADALAEKLEKVVVALREYLSPTAEPEDDGIPLLRATLAEIAKKKE